MDYDSWLSNQVESYWGICEPKLDGDGDAMNCILCNNDDCEYYKEYHYDYGT